LSLRTRLQNNNLEPDLNNIRKNILKTIDVYEKNSIDDFVTTELDTKYGISLNKFEKEKLIEDIYRAVNGYGAIETLLEDTSITSIFVNSPEKIFVEKNGKIYKTKLIISNLEKIINRIAEDCKVELDKDNPAIETVLPSGARVNIIMSPFNSSPILTIKKYRSEMADMNTLVNNEFLSEKMGKFLVKCVQAKKNIIICGLANSGRTTLVNALAQNLPENERIAVIEDFPEINLPQENVIKCKNFKTALSSVMKMLPNRLIIDACHNVEDIKTIIDSGYKGIILSISHSNPTSLEIENSVIVTVKQTIDGTRKVVSIFDNKELFRYKQCLIENDKLIGEFEVLSKVPDYCDEEIPVINNTQTLKSRITESKEN